MPKRRGKDHHHSRRQRRGRRRRVHDTHTNQLFAARTKKQTAGGRSRRTHHEREAWRVARHPDVGHVAVATESVLNLARRGVTRQSTDIHTGSHRSLLVSWRSWGALIAQLFGIGESSTTKKRGTTAAAAHPQRYTPSTAFSNTLCGLGRIPRSMQHTLHLVLAE